MKPYKNSSKANLRKDIFVSPNHLTHHHSSSSRKRTVNCDRYKTTEKSTPSRSEINTRFPSLLISSATSATRTSIQSSMCAGGTITYASAKETNTRQHSKPDTASLSLQSCTSDSPIRQRPSKL